MKKKILVVSLIVCILVLSIASTTMAYFTDTEEATNTFTVGDVKIKLTEINQDGAQKEADGTALQLVYKNIYPTQTILKQPTITNISTADNVYIGAVITLKTVEKVETDFYEEIANLFADENAVKEFLSGGALNTASGYAVKVVATDTYTYTVYIIAKDSVANDDGNGVILFEDLVIPATWDNEDMAIFSTLSIKVDAYATQVAGLADGVTAITTVFGANAGDAFNGVFN